MNDTIVKNKSRASIKTIANELGISTCTVNKALNNKPRISESMRERVVETAERLGYRPNQLARSLVRGELNIALIYPSAWPSYMENLINGVRAKLYELHDYRVNGIQIKVNDFYDANECVVALKKAANLKVDGIVLVLGLYPQAMRFMIWNQLAGMKIPYILLAIDVEEQNSAICRVCQNSLLCGQMAANLLTLMVPAKHKAAIFIGQVDVFDHRLKVVGFREQILSGNMEFVGFFEAHDRQDDAYPLAQELFAKHPDTAAIYIATENSEGILKYLTDNQLEQKVKVVSTGHSQTVVAHIKNNRIQASINENLILQGQIAMDILFRYLTLNLLPQNRRSIEPTVVLKTNVDYLFNETAVLE